MQKNQRFLVLALLTSVVFISGCVNPGKNMMPKDTGPTMAQIYNQKTGVTSHEESSGDGDTKNTMDPEKPAQITTQTEGMITNADYTMTAQNQVGSLFKMLPNPSIAVYVFPHMSQFNNTDVPVPGYTTAFFLYEKNHYAMPGEVY